MTLALRPTSQLIRLEPEDLCPSQRVVGTGSVYVLLDCSGSMKGLKLDAARRGAIQYAAHATSAGYSVGLITFSKLAVVVLSATQSVSAVEQACGALVASGPTDLGKALNLATARLIGQEGHRVVVVVTDGMPDDRAAALRERDLAVASGLTVVAIGTDDADVEFLRDLASEAALSVKATMQELAGTISRAAGFLPAGGSWR